MKVKNKNKYLDAAVSYIMNQLNLDEDEALSVLASNPELLTIGFGLEVFLWSRLNNSKK